jgi:hypothetical protein
LNQSVCEPSRLTIDRFRAHRPSDEPIYLAGCERLYAAVERGLDKTGTKLIGPGDIADDEDLPGMSDAE